MENKRDIIDESLVYSINIFNANALQSINSSKKNSFINMDGNTSIKYVTPSLIIIPLCVAILSIIICTDSIIPRIIIPLLIIFSMVVYILSFKKYDFMSIFNIFRNNGDELNIKSNTKSNTS